MGVIIIILLVFAGLYVWSKANEADQIAEKEERKRKIKKEKAIYEGKSYYSERFDARGELRVDVNTGERYREEYIRGHRCRFDESGRLLHDYTAEQVNHNLSHTKDLAKKEGKRFYMVDNSGCEVYAKYGCDGGVMYRDILTGKDYCLVYTYYNRNILLLLDPDTLYLYDVVKTKDGRGYLDGNVCKKALETYIEDMNWITAHTGRNERLKQIKRECWAYVYKWYDGETEEVAEIYNKNWRNCLVFDVRDEFKTVADFPLLMAKQDPKITQAIAFAESCSDIKSVI